MRYRPIDVALWSKTHFLGLSDDGKLVFFHLRTSPFTTSFGLFRASVAALTDEISLSQPKPWTSQRYLKAAGELQAADLAYYDEPNRLWFIPAGLSSPTSPNALRSWRPLFDELPESKLKDAWLSRLDEIAQGLRDGMRDAIADAFPMSCGMASAMGLILISNSSSTEHEKVLEKGKEGELPKLFLDFVRMTPSEHEKLVSRLGQQMTDTYIERLNGYIGQIGMEAAQKKYRSHYFTILNWVRVDEKKSSSVDRFGGRHDRNAASSSVRGDSEPGPYSGFGTTV